MPGAIGNFKSSGFQIFITDADYLQDMFRTYDKAFTKHRFSQSLFGKFTWHSLIWARSDEPSYKPRRQLISHAFYASKLHAMSDTIFDTIHSRTVQWPQLFPQGQLDLVSELVQIQG